MLQTFYFLLQPQYMLMKLESLIKGRWFGKF